MFKRIRLAVMVVIAALAVACSGAPNQPYINSDRTAIPAEFPMQAHWVRRGFILMPKTEDTSDRHVFRLDLKGLPQYVAKLRPRDMPEDVAARWPHLSDWQAYALTISRDDARAALKDQLFIAKLSPDSSDFVSGVQIPGVLDHLYAEGNDGALEETEFGAHIKDDGVQFKLWAPTAKSVNVFFAKQGPMSSFESLPMRENPRTGIWSLTTDERAAGDPYMYQIKVFHPASNQVETVFTTDPYSLALTRDSRQSVVIDLDHEDTQPAGWDAHPVPAVDRPEELIIYETHIGDFSGTDQSVPEAYRGKYLAFAERETDGMQHLKVLKSAGLNVIHLLPTYDLGSIPESAENQLKISDPVSKACGLIDNKGAFCETADPDQSLWALLQSFDPANPDAQAVMEAVDEVDDYNWGYDPYHYTVPEGSYAVEADGAARIREFRQMVQSLHEMGYRVVMDVVYNHTFQSGLNKKSVLDKTVPGYYHRLNPVSGAIEQSTCCENTATEHAMMAKLMTDSLVTWAEDYKIDGFRFDLMGHQPRSEMLAARGAVRAVDPDTYFYGEGWNFGEVANNARFRQASQMELSGTEIGTFTDRLRDAVRGGSSFNYGDDIRKGQGLGNGLHQIWNELYSGADETADTYALHADQVRIGLAGNLADFEIEDRTGAIVTGADVPYGDGPAGYAADPADTINYVSKHDNQTLWDNNQYRIPFDVDTETRVRMQAVSLSYPLYAQGIPFLHMGTENLRSKSYLRDSYNYGHWFNAVDWTGEDNNYNIGLPPAGKDEANWPLITRIVENNQGRDRVSAEHIAFMNDKFAEMIHTRSLSPLFSLPDADAIKQRVSFHNTGPNMQNGLIVMSIDDGPDLSQLDNYADRIVVIFNHSNETQNFELDTEGFMERPVLTKLNLDPVMRLARAKDGTFTVPAWTTAVFIKPQAGN